MKNLLIEVSADGQGLFDITDKISQAVAGCDVAQGLVHLFIRHTSASLTIQENADPKVLHDMQRFIERLVPEDPTLYTHNEEGPDDMPAHIKACLTQTHLSIPIMSGKLALGTWQGVYLWEHRHHIDRRELLLSIQSFD